MTDELVDIWTPLLEYFDEQYSNFSRLLAERMIDLLQADGPGNLSILTNMAWRLTLVCAQMNHTQTLWQLGSLSSQLASSLNKARKIILSDVVCSAQMFSESIRLV